MKKLLSKLIILTLLINILMCNSALADNNYTQSATLNYTVEGSYMIYIPMEITVGTSAEIRAEEINIPDNKKIVISFSNLIGDGYVELTNEYSDDIVKVYFETDSGIKYQPYSTICKITSSSQGSSYNFRTYAEHESVRAGEYYGYVEFLIDYLDL